MDGAFRTALCDLLGIDYPVLQSGMGSIAGPALVAEVSRAGGLGILGGLNLPAEALRDRIRQIRAATDKPFGVNLWLHTELRPPADPKSLSSNMVNAVQGTLNRFRERLGLPAATARPRATPDVIDEAFELLLEERVPVWSIGLGNPGSEMVGRCHERGIKVVAMVATVEDAIEVDRAGVDAIVAQGGEAGGHRSTWVKRSNVELAAVGTVALVPQIVDAVKAPVIAAGGLADGRGLVAALALGACGILLGTRFVATREATTPDFYKTALVERGGEATTITDAFTGLHARAMRSRFTEDYRASGAPVLPSLLQAAAAQDIFAKAAEIGDSEHYPMWAGQSAGLIDDLPGAAEVVEAIIREAREELASLSERVRLS